MLAQGLIVLVGLGAAAFVLGCVEFLLAWRLTSSVFRFGPQVFAETIAGTHGPLIQSRGVHKVRGGRFRFANDDEIVFFRNVLVAPSTPFPIKGRVVFDRNSKSALVCGRIPLGVTVFFAIWLLAWTVGGAAVVAKQDRVLNAFLFGLIMCVGCLGVAWLWRSSLRLEKQRVSELLAEVIGVLSKQTQ